MTRIEPTSEPALVPEKPPESPRRAPRSVSFGRYLSKYGIFGILVLLVIVAQTLYPGFLSSRNIMDILAQNAAVGIIAIAMTFVIISGGFDLSVGAIYALGGTVFAGLTLSHSVEVGFVAALVFGVLLGAANGMLISFVHVNPFIATLGTGSAILGLAYLYSNSSPFIVRDDDAFAMLGHGTIAGVRIPVFVLVVTVLIAGLVLASTTFGRYVRAIGASEEASRLTGLPVALVKITVYAASGAIAALAGMLDASRLSVGQADVGGALALDAIAIVVVGGTSLRGGEGAVWRTVVGLFIFASLTNVFYSLNLSQNWQLIAKGLIVVLAVSVDARLRTNR